MPPSSILTCERLSAEFLTMCLAVSGPPVKAIFSIKSWVVKAFPQGSPKPVIMFTTPFGRPAFSISLPNSNNEKRIAARSKLLNW